MKKSVFLILCLLVATLSAESNAQSLITEFVSPEPFDFRNPVTIGYEFRTGAVGVNATTLGMWDEGQDGFASEVEVGLWESAGTLLGLVTIPAGTGGTLDGEFRYTSLANPISLAPNTQYVIGAYRLPGVSYSASGTTATVDFLVDPNFFVIQERASSSTGGEPNIVFPWLVFEQNEALVGPNLQFTAVPEPSAGWLVFMLVGGLTGRRRIV